MEDGTGPASRVGPGGPSRVWPARPPPADPAAGRAGHAPVAVGPPRERRGAGPRKDRPRGNVRW